MHVTRLAAEMLAGGWRVPFGSGFALDGQVGTGQDPGGGSVSVIDCVLQGESIRFVFGRGSERVEKVIDATNLQISAVGHPAVKIVIVDLNQEQGRTVRIGGRDRTVRSCSVALVLEHPERIAADPVSMLRFVGKTLNVRAVKHKMLSGLLERIDRSPVRDVDVRGDAVTINFHSGASLTVALHVENGRPSLAIGTPDELVAILTHRR